MPRVIVYGYPTSPYYQKVLMTLAFCGVEYEICSQPRQLPRPDFESIGVNYRRIPLLSIDGDLYADTSLICSKLCALAGKTEYKAYEHMAKEMFNVAAGLIPFKLIADEAFLKDRSELTGRPWSEKAINGSRPAALSQFLSYASKVDEMLKQGDYVNGSTLTMADVHLLTIFQWILFGHKGAEPEVSPSTHPRLYGWVKRCQGQLPRVKAKQVKFDEARRVLLGSSPATSAGSDGPTVAEPLGFKVGDTVTVTPTDTGRTHPQPGRIDSITPDEVAVITDAGVRIHLPRLGYTIKRQQGKAAL